MTCVGEWINGRKNGHSWNSGPNSCHLTSLHPLISEVIRLFLTWVHTIFFHPCVEQHYCLKALIGQKGFRCGTLSSYFGLQTWELYTSKNFCCPFPTCINLVTLHHFFAFGKPIDPSLIPPPHQLRSIIHPINWECCPQAIGDSQAYTATWAWDFINCSSL